MTPKYRVHETETRMPDDPLLKALMTAVGPEFAGAVRVNRKKLRPGKYELVDVEVSTEPQMVTLKSLLNGELVTVPLHALRMTLAGRTQLSYQVWKRGQQFKRLLRKAERNKGKAHTMAPAVGVN